MTWKPRLTNYEGGYPTDPQRVEALQMLIHRVRDKGWSLFRSCVDIFDGFSTDCKAPRFERIYPNLRQIFRRDGIETYGKLSRSLVARRLDREMERIDSGKHAVAEEGEQKHLF